MHIVMPKVDKEGNVISSVSPGERSGGIHPTTGLTIRNCICSSPLCRQLMWILASINAWWYFPYVRLPNKPKQGEKSTPTKDHANACRKNHFHHLHGYGDDFYKSRPDLALHLYGLPWEQHKEVGDALFGTDDEDIDDLKENGWDVSEGVLYPLERHYEASETAGTYWHGTWPT